MLKENKNGDLFECFMPRHLTSILVLLSGGTSETMVYDEFWAVNPKLGSWSLISHDTSGDPGPRFGHGTVVYADSMFLFGGTDTYDVFNDTWVFNMTTAQWTQLQPAEAPDPREAFVMLPMPGNRLFLFGGYNGTVGQQYDDAWQFDIANTVWSRIDGSLDNPDGRSFFGGALVNHTQIVIWGGENIETTYDPNHVWALDTTTMQWRTLNHSRDSYHPPPTSGFSMNAFGCKKVIVSGGTYFVQNGTIIPSENIFTGGFVDYDTWEWQQMSTSAFELRQYAVMMTVGQSDDACVINRGSTTDGTISSKMPSPSTVMVAFGANVQGSQLTEAIVQAIMPACDAGYYAEDFVNSCHPCPLGSYATAPGSKNCTRCAVGVRTASIVSTLASDCNTCLESFCGHGTCSVAAESGQATCSCSVFFSASSRCSELSVFSIAIISAVGSIVVLVIMTVALRYVLKTRLSNTDLQKKLQQQQDEFEKAWEINEHDVTLTKLLGEGGYGQVWFGLWGDRPVAVKKLITNQLAGDANLIDFGGDNSTSSRESTAVRASSSFEQEIKLIRKIKHVNIVLCYGAGVCVDGARFLVLELCSRGSLRDVLTRHDEDWPRFRQIEVALHAARGIQYLHSMKPPSIHRDIKSPNILISDGWVAKIADFGSAQLVEADGNVSRRADEHGIGSLLWNAPELYFGKHHSTASDVYRFVHDDVFHPHQRK